ncbi:hypothetical protein HKBW3S43_00939, partial [Candidatus Hakubella thermalkaliphila]
MKHNIDSFLTVSLHFGYNLRYERYREFTGKSRLW